MKILKLPHSFFVMVTHPGHKIAIDDFLKTLTKWETKTEFTRCPYTGRGKKTKVRIPKYQFCAKANYGYMYGFLKAEYGALKNYLGIRSYRLDDAQQLSLPSAPIRDADIKMHDWVKPREHQVEATAFSIRPGGNVTVMHCSTGWGKTFAGIFIANHRKTFTAYVMSPGHIKTWRNSYDEFTDLDIDKDIFYIEGSDRIAKAMKLIAKGEFNYQSVMISADTLRSFITNYEAGECKLGVTPFEFWNALGAGQVVFDESHEALHALVRNTIYCTVSNLLYLSATLVSDDPFYNKVYDKVFPRDCRYESAPNTHVIAMPMYYRAAKELPSNGFMGYSHIKYEKSILKRKGTSDNFLKLIDTAIGNYDETHKPGKKMLILASSIKMCEFIREHVVAKWGKYKSAVYVAGSPDANLYDMDITVSTLKSAGTGKDIPNLSHLFMTTALSSVQLGKQAMGRLRPMKDFKDDDPVFMYAVDVSNKTHLKYDKKRKLEFARHTKKFIPFPTGIEL